MSEAYTWQEFPKWLHHEGKPSTLVEDAASEAALLAEWTEPTVAPVAAPEAPADEAHGE